MATQITQTETAAATANDVRREVISYDPQTGEEGGRAPLESGGSLSFRERAAVVMRARAVVLEELEEIAALVSRESGKPLAEAVSMEIVPTLDLMQFFARKTERMLRPERIDIGLYNFLGRTSTIEYRPLGVVGIISPWNFPWAIPLGEVVMAT